MKISKKIIKISALICAFTVIISAFTSCTDAVTEKTSFAMGSVLTAKIYTEDTEKGEEIFSIINNAAADAELALSNTQENAEIYILNNEKKIYASDYLRSVLMDTVLLCNVLNRKTDITIGRVTKLWGFSSDSPSVPESEELQKELANADIEKILIDDNSNKITIEEDIELDLGAFGKGAACDAAFEAAELYYTPFIMTLGGTVLAYGKGPSDGKWTIGIRDPFGDANSYFATLSLTPAAPKNAAFVSTSGSYEKTFTENGKTYHHIIDTKTGYPVETDLVSVTVVANSGLNADALSTFCFINGLNEATLTTLKSFDADAVFVFNDKTYYVTDGLKDSLKITDSDFTPNDYEA